MARGPCDIRPPRPEPRWPPHSRRIRGFGIGGQYPVTHLLGRPVHTAPRTAPATGVASSRPARRRARIAFAIRATILKGSASSRRPIRDTTRGLDRRLSTRRATATGGAGATPKAGASRRSREIQKSGDQEAFLIIKSPDLRSPVPHQPPPPPPPEEPPPESPPLDELPDELSEPLDAGEGTDAAIPAAATDHAAPPPAPPDRPPPNPVHSVGGTQRVARRTLRLRREGPWKLLSWPPARWTRPPPVPRGRMPAPTGTSRRAAPAAAAEARR